MKVLVACEYSGRVRDAFLARGHNAISCDLLPSDKPGPHILGNVLDLLDDPSWDLMVGFPPCTHLCVSGAAKFKEKRQDGRQQQGIAFFSALYHSKIPRICIENPVGIMSGIIGKPSQVIQPWMFGHGETKATCLWLKNLPLLKPTNYVKGRQQRLHKLPPSPNRAKLRSLTYSGVAEAMAQQWGDPNNPIIQKQLTLF